MTIKNLNEQFLKTSDSIEKFYVSPEQTGKDLRGFSHASQDAHFHRGISIQKPRRSEILTAVVEWLHFKDDIVSFI